MASSPHTGHLLSSLKSQWGRNLNIWLVWLVTIWRPQSHWGLSPSQQQQTKKQQESKHMALSQRVLTISVIRFPRKTELSYSRCWQWFFFKILIRTSTIKRKKRQMSVKKQLLKCKSKIVCNRAKTAITSCYINRHLMIFPMLHYWSNKSSASAEMNK